MNKFEEWWSGSMLAGYENRTVAKEAFIAGMLAAAKIADDTMEAGEDAEYIIYGEKSAEAIQKAAEKIKD